MDRSAAAARGWIVTLAGTGINLALGVLYSWSVIAKTLTSPDGWGWSAAGASLPYAVACGTFALTMVFAGRAQDRFGPRLVATLGGALTGLGLILASAADTNAVWLVVTGFGLLAGAGIGLGYASATPPAIKWFPPARKGLITGLVVSGFGLASVYIAPLTQSLIGSVGLNRTLFFLGLAFMVVTVALAQLLVNPPKDYVPAVTRATADDTTTAQGKPGRDYTWREMVRTPQFRLLWVMYAFASFAGLMIIGHMAKIASAQVPGAAFGFVLVAVLAVGNAGGRIAAGLMSDFIGRTRTMFAVFVFQAVMMAFIAASHTAAFIAIAAALVGFNYGANLALFPAVTADYFGTKNLGVNYGIVFTAWGVGGVFGSMVAGRIFDATGSYGSAFLIAAVLCGIAATTSLFAKAPAVEKAEGLQPAEEIA